MAKKSNSKIQAKKIILDFINSKADKLCSYDEISRVVFKAVEAKSSTVEQQLVTLVELGNIYKTPNNKYISVKSSFLKGKISITKRDISVEYNDETYPLSNDPKSLDLFFNGDEVLFIKNKSRVDLIKVFKRANSQVTGTIEFMSNFSFLIPDNSFGRDLIVEFDHLHGAQDGDKVIAQVYYWPRKNRERVKAKVIKILGQSGSLETERECVISSQEVPREFSSELLSFAENIDDSIKFENRVNLVQQRCFTIDPDTAKDFDDSIFVEKTNKGFNLFVHIADVSHYVEKGSIIDTEALKRGNSIYTPGEVIPMLPERLSNFLCSLRPNELKYSFTCEMKLDEKAEIICWKFYHSIIESKKRFTYSEAQEISDGNLESDFIDEIMTLKEFALLVKENNNERGYINFDLPECDIVLNKDKTINEIKLKQEIFANKMVEVCMLLANECAAKEIENSDIHGIFRIHEKPDPLKVQELLESFALYGINIEFNQEITPKFVNDTLTEYANSGSSGLINEQLLRAMQKAVYSHQNVGHFGLALENYTHFTSPIRRYADLIVHRAINAILAKNHDFYSELQLKDIANHISTTERTAITIERKIQKLYFVEFMKDKIGEVFNAKISGVISNGVFVQLENSPIEGMIPIKFMGSKINDNFSFDAEKNSFYSKYSGELYMGVKLVVRLKKVNQKKAMIDFEILDIIQQKK